MPHQIHNWRRARMLAARIFYFWKPGAGGGKLEGTDCDGPADWNWKGDQAC